MTSSRAVVGLNNRKSGVNRHLPFFHFQKTRKCAVLGADFNSEMAEWVPWLNE